MKNTEKNTNKDIERNYKRDNETARRAIEKEEDFLKKDVIGKGAKKRRPEDLENERTNFESPFEK